MDDIVKQAMAKWPNVPAVYGWLSLDRRGRWLIKGERITNLAIVDFIGRNYLRDEQGCWYFQNGPQRVFIALDYTPFVYHVAWTSDANATLRIASQTATNVTRVNAAWIDDEGTLLLDTELGIGIMDDRELDRLLPQFTDAQGHALTEDAIDVALETLRAENIADIFFRHDDRLVPVAAIKACAIPTQFGYIQHPLQPEGQEKC